jgi:uncharacterized membrane protein YoaK (UPF0700 family)
MTLIKGIMGGVMLILGRELNFLFAGSMTALLAIRFISYLPSNLPSWSSIAFVAGTGILVAAVAMLNERVGFVISGFVAGGYILSEYYSPGTSGVPILPFIVGSGLGAIIMGLLTEWAMIVVSSVIGAVYVTSTFTLGQTERTLVTAGLVVVGLLVQVVIMRMQKQAENKYSR